MSETFLSRRPARTRKGERPYAQRRAKLTSLRAPNSLRALSNVEQGYSENEAATWEGPDDELLDVRQAAVLLTVKSSTLAFWARQGGCQ
jgi:hypothetical protein